MLSNKNDQNNSLIPVKKSKLNELNLIEKEKNDQLKNINFKKNPFFHLKYNIFTKKKIFYLFKPKLNFKQPSKKILKQKIQNITKPVIYKKKNLLSQHDTFFIKYSQQLMPKEYILENLDIFNKNKVLFFSKTFFNNFEKAMLNKKINFFYKNKLTSSFFLYQYIIIKKSNAEKYKSEFFNLQYQLNNLYINKSNIKIFNNYKITNKIFNFVDWNKLTEIFIFKKINIFIKSKSFKISLIHNQFITWLFFLKIKKKKKIKDKKNKEVDLISFIILEWKELIKKKKKDKKDKKKLLLSEKVFKRNFLNKLKKTLFFKFRIKNFLYNNIFKFLKVIFFNLIQKNFNIIFYFNYIKILQNLIKNNNNLIIRIIKKRSLYYYALIIIDGNLYSVFSIGSLLKFFEIEEKYKKKDRKAFKLLLQSLATIYLKFNNLEFSKLITFDFLDYNIYYYFKDIINIAKKNNFFLIRLNLEQQPYHFKKISSIPRNQKKKNIVNINKTIKYLKKINYKIQSYKNI